MYGSYTVTDTWSQLDASFTDADLASGGWPSVEQYAELYAVQYPHVRTHIVFDWNVFLTDNDVRDLFDLWEVW